MKLGYFLNLSFIVLVLTHEKWDDPKKPSHEDFDPVVEFPDNDPNYRPAEWNRDESSDEERDHNQIHKLVTTMVHTQMQLQRNIADLKQAIRDQKMRRKQQQNNKSNNTMTSNGSMAKGNLENT